MQWGLNKHRGWLIHGDKKCKEDEMSFHFLWQHKYVTHAYKIAVGYIGTATENNMSHKKNSYIDILRILWSF